MIIRKHELVSVQGYLTFTQKVARVEATGDGLRVVITEAGKEYPQTWRVGENQFVITDPPILESMYGTFTRADESEDEITRRAMTFEQWEQAVAEFQQMMFRDPKIRRYISDFSSAMTDGGNHLTVNTEDIITELDQSARRRMYEDILAHWRRNRYVVQYDLPTWIQIWEELGLKRIDLGR